MHTNNIIIPDNLSQDNVLAFFTNRYIQKQITPIVKEMGYGHFKVFMPSQRHTSDVYLLNESIDKNVVADSVITIRKNVFIGIAIADCVPILLYDTINQAIGAVHAGWRGTAGGILKNTLSMMEHSFKTQPENIYMAIGPCIHKCCYQVGHEVVEEITESTGQGQYVNKTDRGLYIDLKEANRLQAEACGITNIWVLEKCTFCNNTEFFSYRREGKNAGRQAGFIGLIN